MRKMQFLSVLALGTFLLSAHPVSAMQTSSFQVSLERRRPNGRDGLETLRTPGMNEIVRGQMLDHGQSGPVVEIIRSLLLELDYPVEPAGDYFDRELSYQIGRFQLDNHLAVPDSPNFGRVDSDTLQILRDLSAKGRFNMDLGRKLADYARSRISGGSGYCYHYVAKAIEASMGRFLKGLHAYMAADQLASSGYFKEIRVLPIQLPTLPAGAVVVWEKGKSRSGHISIADGRGNEISDHISAQMTFHYGGGNYRVFLPIART